jgi:hypothetical protein
VQYFAIASYAWNIPKGLAYPEGIEANSRWLRSVSDDTTGEDETTKPATPKGSKRLVELRERIA